MGTPNKYRKDMCSIAEEILGSGKSLAAVCSKLNIARSTLYEWADNHSDFKAAISRGLERCQEKWEEIGLSGMTGAYEKFSAAPWIFTMKNRFRVDYAEEKEAKSESTSIIEKLIDKLAE
jgi:hypothetical protein